jgi:hypothetical protein
MIFTKNIAVVRDNEELIKQQTSQQIAVAGVWEETAIARKYEMTVKPKEKNPMA